MTTSRMQRILLITALLVAPLSMMISCGGNATPAAAAPVYNPAPAVVISGVTSTPVSAPVTITFTFSQPVSNFPASAVTVTNGTKADATTKKSPNWYTLVVTPAANSAGTMTVGVAAAAFSSAAGIPNAAAAGVSQPFDTRPAPQVQMSLPVTFDLTTVNYGLLGFGGAEDSTIVVDPAGGTNKVAKVVKSATAETWAGTTLTADGTLGFSAKIPFDASNTRMTVRVYSPNAGIPVRLKVEDHTAASVSVETEATTTLANSWETLTFDFSNAATGTAALNVASTYDKATIFFNFGVAGATAGAKTYYFDDVTFLGGTGSGGGGTSSFAPITFDDSAVTYTLTGFGGAEDSTVVVDPTSATNHVVRVNRSAAAATWAGTTVSTGANLSVATLPFDATHTQLTVRTYSPAIGIHVRLKVEDAANNTHTCETEAITTVANAWETLTFNFANPATGTAALDLTFTFNKISIFFNFGTDGATAGAQTYYFDDVTFVSTGSGGGGGTSSFAPVTFDDSAVTYTLTGFGGAEDSTVVVDPTSATNHVVRVNRSAAAATWAGTTVSTGANLSIATLPFDATHTQLTVRTYSPAIGIHVRLKVEDAANNTHTCETEAITTVANAWETLTFNFANPATGTAALDLTFTFNKISIFFNFGTDGATAGAQTYYFDDVAFVSTGSGGGGGTSSFAPVTFDDSAVTYTLTGFGGAEDSTVVVDPTSATNHVAKVNRSATAATWAGTTVSTGANLSVATLPFSASKKSMTVRVWSPDAGIQVRLKVEDAANNTHTCETEATVTTAAGWQTLTFNFANPATGTAALDLTFTFNKISIFFNFGTDGATAGAKTYYFDDITFVP